MTKKPATSKTDPVSASIENLAKTQSATANSQPLVGIIMGSSSDWETMEHAVKTLTDLGVPHETKVVSAHRTPDLLFDYASTAEQRGLEVLIAGAGGAAHLPGMTASKTVLPVLGVPVESKALKGLDSLLSIAQMPGGIPVGTLAIGKAGAINSALLAAAILGAKHPAIREALRKFRIEQTERVLANPDPSLAPPSAFRLTSPESPTADEPASDTPVAATAKRKPA
jgi:5-(carboxyamino)imidazole ribonucleotide mutase